jgi:hypothetical protein
MACWRACPPGHSTVSTRVRLLRVVLLVLAVAGIVLGAMNGEVRTVVTKAINVCLECIGIG